MARHVAASVLAAIAVIVVAILCRTYFFPSDESRITHRLEQLADDVTRSSADAPGGLARTARMATYFTEDVVVEPGEGVEPIRGRDALMALSTSLRGSGGTLRAAVTDVHVKLLSETAADVTLTATVEKSAGGAQPSLDAREFALQMVRQGTWRIARVTAVDTLR